jgi:hypothetical protein
MNFGRESQQLSIRCSSDTKNNEKNNNCSYLEKIVFYTKQLCPGCKKTNDFDPSEILESNISSEKDIFEYKCNNCGAKKNFIDVKYQILLIFIEKSNNPKEKDKEKGKFITKVGEIKLFSPFRLYSDLKYDQLARKDYTLKIDHIYNEKKNDLFNYIFYFYSNNLTFDFLIPYRALNDSDMELIENQLFSIISDINKQRFSTKNELNNESLMKEMENEFVPINISDSYLCEKANAFQILIPKYSKGDLNGKNDKDKEKNSYNFSILSSKNKEQKSS